MSVSLWQDLNPQTIQADMVIIGAGISGLSAAYWLGQKDPDLKIAIVEKGDLGQGASGRNAGFVTCGSVEHFNRLVGTFGQAEAYNIWNFSEENLRLLKEHIIKDQEEKIGFEEKGSFSLAATKEELAELKNSASYMTESNINVAEVDQNFIENQLGAKGFIGGIHYKDDGSVHPIKLLKLMKSKLSPNTKCYFDTEVFKIERSSDKRIVHCKNKKFETDAVILATNGYSYQLSDYFKDKIFPTRGQILATAPVEKFMAGPCYANFYLDYFRQLPTGEMVIGGFRQLQADTEKGVSDETSDLIQNALEQFLRNHLDRLKDVPITYRWSGIMGFSVDGQPMIGSLPSDSQIYFLGGHTCHGLGLAFHCGKALSDLMWGDNIPSFINAKRF